jgi:excisionase family DNA binding protein
LEDILERQAVSIMKAAQMVGVSRRTIYNWLASGKLDYVRTAGGSVRIFVDSLWRDPVRSGEHAAPTGAVISGLTALGS